MAEYNVKMNVKTDTGYDQLYPASKSDIIDFDKTSSNLSSTNVEAAIKEVNTKVNTAQSTANTNKTNIGTLTSLDTDSKTNLVGAINEVDSHANSAQTTANSANSTANTNKTNIGTLSSLKTAIKTNIVNAINSLYDNTIGKTLKTLNEVKLATEEGYYADALVVKELNSNLTVATKPVVIAAVKTIMQEWDITFKKTDMKNILIVYALVNGYRNQVIVPVDALGTLYSLQVPWQDGHTVTYQLRYEEHPNDATLNRIFVLRLVKTGAWASVDAQLEVRTV